MQRANYQFYDGLFDKLIFIPVEINGFHVTAMFDTGAAISIIANSLARKIKACVIENPLTAVNNNGKSFRIEKAAVSSINLGGITIENAVSGIIPDDYFDFGVDGNGKTFPAQMFLGWDIISRFYWRIDKKNKSYCILKDGPVKANNLFYTDYPVIKLTYGTEPLFFGFDTGHTETILDKTWHTRLDNLKPAKTETRGVGSSRTERALVTHNLALQYEKVIFNLNYATVLPNAVFGVKNNSVAGLLGIDFFENTAFEIDFKNRYFYIEK